MTWEQFQECVRIQGGLDFEAVDVAFVQPLKDLHAWWESQSPSTKAYVDWFTGGLGGAALTAFIARVLQTTAGALATLAAEALGAVIVGLTLGVVMDILARCEIQAVLAP
jgi:hypothetical protein